MQDSLSSSYRYPLLVALVVACIYTIADFSNIRAMHFLDPDDILRLIQVRDLLNGQAWFDVTQYRINPPAGGLMHWSRLIDLPLAALIVILRPIFGQPVAEHIALISYSLLMLTALFLVAARILRLYYRPGLVLVGLPAIVFLQLLMSQFRVMRIDHHSAQILIGCVAFGLVVAPWRRWTGLAVGALLAVLTSISLEGIIYIPAFGLVFAWPWLMRGKNGDPLAGYCLSFVLTSVIVMVATRGASAPLTSYCDSMSRPYLAASAMAALILLVGTRWRLPVFLRLCVVVIAGAAATGTLGLSDARCLRGPFEALPPFVQTYWYDMVEEGMPLWGKGTQAFNFILLHVIAITGIGIALYQHRRDKELYRRWLITAFLYGWALAVGLIVLRANGMAYAFGLGGIALVTLHCWQKARAISNTLVRILASVATPVLVAMLLQLILFPSADHQSLMARAGTNASQALCFDPASLAKLNSLPSGLVFTTIDMAPEILLNTPHSVVATGHHRNANGIDKTLRAFRASSEGARPIIASTGSDYLIYCASEANIPPFAQLGPEALSNRLKNKQPPAWLTPVEMPRGSTLQVYRITPDV